MELSIGKESSNQSLTSTVRQKYANFARTISAHGFPYTVDGPIGRRVAATVVIVIFVSIAGSFTYLAIKDFLNGPGFNSEYKLVYTPSSSPQPLAVFAICDISPWDFGKAERAGISVQLVSYLSFFIFPFEGTHKLFSNTTESRQKLEELESSYLTLVAQYGTVTALLNAVTRSCEETFFYCRAGLGEVLDGQDCCSQNFHPPVYTNEGKCFETAGKMTFKQPFAVKPQGLTLGVLVGPDVSATLDSSTGAFQATLQRGVSVVISGRTDHIFTSTTKRSYLTMPNTMNSVALQKTVIDSSGLELCAHSDDSEVISDKTPGFRHYSRDNCQFHQFQAAAIASRGCALFLLPNPDKLPECSPLVTTKFFEQVGGETAAEGAERREADDSVCPLDCILEEYSARVSSHQVTSASSSSSSSSSSFFSSFSGCDKYFFSHRI